MKYGPGLLTAMLGAASYPLTALEAEPSLHPYLDRSHQFLAGAYFQELHAEIRETKGPLPQQAVNLRHLGVDDTHTTWQLEYRYRINERWGLVASAHTFSGQGTRGNSREFNFAGVRFGVGAKLHTKIDVDTYVFDVVYTTYRSPRAELAIGVGIHAFDFATKIEGQTLVGRDENSDSVAFEEFLAPLPNVRLQGFYALDPRWSLTGGMGWMSADIDEWSGDFLHLYGRLQFLFTDKLGVALGYQFTDLDVSRDRRRRKSQYDLEFSGPSLQLTYGF